MIEYGQFCPIAKASEVLGERWTSLVVRELGAGSESFNDLRRGLPLMSPALLSARLKSLQANGVVERTENGRKVRYALTEAGRELKPILLALGKWGQRWVRSEFDDKDLDPSMLMWDIHRTINVDFFGDERAVLMFEFQEYTSRLRRWWLIVDNGEVDVCMKDPGHDVDLHVLTDVRSLTRLWIGDLSYADAFGSGALQLSGQTRLRRGIAKWLGTNYFADIEPGPGTRAEVDPVT